MLIKDVCKKCKLAKKAVEYYEQQGLISPAVEDNGYRNYSDEDISVLKEIGTLRKLGISLLISRIFLQVPIKPLLWQSANIRWI